MKQVSELIPQRYPLQLIDQFETITPGSGARAIKLVTINEWYFRRENRLEVPRPLLLEMLAQTGTAALATVPLYEEKTIFFGGIRAATFEAPCVPGDRLELVVTLTKVKKQMGMGTGTVKCNGQTRCQAELIFVAQG